MQRKGQTALEYMLMLVVVLALMATVLWMTNTIAGIGETVGGAVAETRVQVLQWLMT
jgi:predicted small secreted protein